MEFSAHMGLKNQSSSLNLEHKGLRKVVVGSHRSHCVLEIVSCSPAGQSQRRSAATLLLSSLLTAIAEGKAWHSLDSRL
jgi:hypothetical protein